MNYHRIEFTFSSSASTEIHPNIEAVELCYAVPVLELKRRFPNLKAVHLDYSNWHTRVWQPDYLEMLCAAFSLESFSMRTEKFQNRPLPPSLWQSSLRDIKIIQYYSELKIHLPFHFKNNLEQIELNGRWTSSIPAILFRSRSLKSIHLCGISEDLVGINGASNVEKLVILGFAKPKLPFDIENLPNLKHFELSAMQLELLPDFRFLKQLEYLGLELSRDLKSVENHWDALQKLQKLKIYTIHNENHKIFYFKSLAQLREIFIDGFSIDPEHAFLGKMPVLEWFKLWNTKVNSKQLSDVLMESPVLKMVEITNCVELTILPEIILTNPNITHLSILNCVNIQMPKEILIKESLVQLSYDFPHYKTIDLSETTFKDNLMTLLAGVPAAQRLALGHLLFGGSDAFGERVEFKNGFLHLLNIKNATMKRLVHENLHLLNPRQAKMGIPTDYQGKTIAFAGTTHKLKSSYKQKLIALNIEYQSIIRCDTNWLIIGNSIALPDHFWNYPHYFFTEQDLELFLTEAHPDFLQHAEQPIAENIQALLYTNDVANEQLVVEMVRAGGIPTHLVPDLVLVAKTSADAGVRATLKKILKAQLPPDVQRILLDPHKLNNWREDHFATFQAFAPNFDVAQMIYCYYKRTQGKGGWNLGEKFMKASLHRGNPHRAEMFEIESKPLFHNTSTLDFRRYYFNPPEVRSILDNPMFCDLEYLMVNMNEIPFATLLKFKRLKHMHLYDATQFVISEKIIELIHLEAIYIYCNELKTLPINVLALPALEKLDVSTDTAMRLPVEFRALQKRLKYFRVEPEPIYE